MDLRNVNMASLAELLRPCTTKTLRGSPASVDIAWRLVVKVLKRAGFQARRRPCHADGEPDRRTLVAVVMAPVCLEAPGLGNEDRAMPKEQAPGKPTTRRYSSEEKAAAVRMVRTLPAELGVTQRTVQRVATQLG